MARLGMVIILLFVVSERITWSGCIQPRTQLSLKQPRYGLFPIKWWCQLLTEAPWFSFMWLIPLRSSPCGLPYMLIRTLQKNLSESCQASYSLCLKLVSLLLYSVDQPIFKGEVDKNGRNAGSCHWRPSTTYILTGRKNRIFGDWS